MTFSLRFAAPVAALLIGVAALLPTALPAAARAEPTGGQFDITDPAIATFFDQYGGAATFGAPISTEFSLSNAPTQIFENGALQVQPDGSVVPLQLTGASVLTSRNVNGLTVPAADAATAFIAPTPDQTNYAARVQVFLQAVVPEPFLSAYNATGGQAVWGLPTSGAAQDPNNPNFSYQRFQNGILFHDATTGTTQPLALGEQLRKVLQAQGVVDAFVPSANDSQVDPSLAA